MTTRRGAMRLDAELYDSLKTAKDAYAEQSGLGKLSYDQFMRKLLSCWKKQGNANHLTKDAVLELVASLEVESLPSDDPELRYWQGYAAAQLDITNKVEQL